MVNTSGVSVRRSMPEDIPSIRSLVLDRNPTLYDSFFGDINLSTEIATSYLSITAVSDSTGEIVGFLSLNDFPRSPNQRIPCGAWQAWYAGEGFVEDRLRSPLHSSNTLWISVAAIAKSDVDSNESILSTMLTAAFATCCLLKHIAVLSPTQDVPLPTFLQPEQTFFQLARRQAIPEKDADPDNEDFCFGKLFVVSRDTVVPVLRLRAGIVEDYDDVVPLLLAGEGVLTELPENLYLEELLQSQDTYHAVVVAEDPLTNKVVGLVCLRSSYEDQQHLARQYATDLFGKLKPQQPQTVKGQQSGHNVFQISFFYLNPEYDTRSLQIVQHCFSLFPYAEYVYIMLQHTTPEHALLNYFAYVPIKRFTPTNQSGERMPLPQGLWLCCRYALDDVAASPIRHDQEDAVTKMLRSQPEVTQDGVEAMCVALSNSIPLQQATPPPGHEKERPSLNALRQLQAQQRDVPFCSCVLTWRETIIGVAIIRYANTSEVYSLRANFDLDTFVNFYPHGNMALHATDITLDPEAAKKTFYRDDVPVVVLKHCYIRPTFRNRLRFLLREVLRLCNAQVIAHMCGMETESFQPLLGELILTPPRRIADPPPRAVGQSGHNDAAGNDSDSEDGGAHRVTADVDGLACLYHTSRKALSDEKTKIHARIVVIGASTTGLAFIHSLLSVPYLHVSNILLVSTDGLPAHPNQRDLQWSADTMDFMEREYIALRVGRRLRIVEGTMIDFDKYDRYICTDGSNCEPYDHLLITAGRQFAIPKEILSQHGAKNGVFPLSNQHYIAKIKQHIHESEIYEDDLSSAVIFGTNLDVFAVAASIVKLGLAAQRVVIVSPEGHQTNPFGDPLVELKVERLLTSLGTKMLKGHTLERLEFDEDNNLCSVVVTPTSEGGTGGGIGGSNKAVELNATMFVYCHGKDIDAQVLSALNKRSIVFDGRVIVENNYRTTDRHIYAAGPVAMFSRRFGPSQDFDVYSARNVGHHLAEALLGFLGVDSFYDPLLHAADEEEKDAGGAALKDDPLAAELGSRHRAGAANAEEDTRRRPKPLPKYESPVVRKVLLPGDHIFFTSYSVGFAEMEAQCTYLTSSSSNGNQYVRIAIGPNKYIESVIYFGDEEVELRNLGSLIGLPEAILNLMYTYSEVNQYSMKKESGGSSSGADAEEGSSSSSGRKPFDILAYLRTPWATVIFQDRLRKVFEKTKELIATHPDVLRVKQDMIQAAAKNGAETVPPEDRAVYHRRLTHEDSNVRHVIELELLKYLHEVRPFLPQLYYLPDLTPYVPSFT